MTLEVIAWKGNALSAANITTAYPSVGSGVVPVGFVERVWMGANSTAGSVYVQESGTAQVIAVLTAGSNVTNIAYPVILRETTANVDLAAGSGNIWSQLTVTNPVFITGSGFTSGTSNVLGTVQLEYRKV